MSRRRLIQAHDGGGNQRPPAETLDGVFPPDRHRPGWNDRQAIAHFAPPDQMTVSDADGRACNGALAPPAAARGLIRS
jgi:hypothetical protein